MIRQKKAPQKYLDMDLLELLHVPITEKHPLGIINAVLYSSSVPDEKSWLAADEYMSLLPSGDAIMILVNWSIKLASSKNEFNELDGKLTLLWLMRHNKLLFVPKWILEYFEVK